VTEKLRTNPISFTGAVGDSIIYGISVATAGEATGHRLLFDQASLDQLVQLGNSKASGIKSRFTHPDWFHDGLGKYLGRVKNFRQDNCKVTGDLYISPTARNSPAGDLAAYVLGLATEDPASFGVSVVVDLNRVWPTTDGTEVPAATGRPSNSITKLPVARITQLYAADLVDEPALNPNGLFHTEEEIRDQYNQEETQIINQILKGENQQMSDQPIQQENDRITGLENQIAHLNQVIENSVINIGNRPPRGQSVSMGASGAEQFQSYFDRLFGAPGSKLPRLSSGVLTHSIGLSPVTSKCVECSTLHASPLLTQIQPRWQTWPSTP